MTTEYYYDDRGTLILLSCEDGTGLYFYPEADGSIGSIGINGNRYYYVRNAQNDIIGITDKTGAFVARYTYDEWGVITSITDGNGNDVSGNPTHIANLNPLRYRSYFYDAETGWYWLNTRYYNPEVGRFINADGYVSTGQDITGFNMFAYCGNNPVNRSDENGEFWNILVGGAVGAIVVATIITTTIVNHIVNACNETKIDECLDDSYDIADAEEEINKILSQYSTDDVSCKITFNEDYFSIEGTYLVDSRYDRQKICEIVRRTGKTNREADNMSAEWFFHNIMYDAHIRRESANPADIDYVRDNRWYIRCATKCFEALGWD